MQDLLAPMPVDHFFQDYYMKEPVHIRRATAAHAPLFKHLFSVEDLDELLEKGGGEPSISRALALKSSNGSIRGKEQLTARVAAVMVRPA